MANRSIVYSLEQIRSFDTLMSWRDGIYSDGWLGRLFLGNTNGVWSGFTPSQTIPTPTLAINFAEGWLLQLAEVDATVYGSLGSDATQVVQNAYGPAQTLTFTTGGLTAGQSQFVLVQCQFQQIDAVRSGDPNGGVLPYINTADPNNPLFGPNNSGAMQDTERQSVAVLELKYGVPATSGMEVAPSPDSGWLPMYLVDLTYGQLTISTGQVVLAGPAAYTGYQNAPYFPGITGSAPGSSGSHHGGIAGQANKINAGTELAGTIGFAQLPVSNTNPASVGGIVTVAGDIPILTQVNANPNGNLAGNVNDVAFLGSPFNTIYVCTTSGSSTTAVWSAAGQGNVSQYKNSAFTVAPGNFVYLCDTGSGAFSATLPLAANMSGTGVTFINIGTSALTITPQSGESIEFGASGAGITLNVQGDYITLYPRASVGWFNTARSDYPGVIKMHKTGIPIPIGWALCDGTNGTNNMLGVYPVGARPTGSSSPANTNGYGILTAGANVGTNFHSHTFTLDFTSQTINNLGAGGSNLLSLGTFQHNHVIATTTGTDNSSFAPAAVGVVFIQKL